MSDQTQDCPSLVVNPSPARGKTPNVPNEYQTTRPPLRCRFDGSNDLVTPREYNRRYCHFHLKERRASRIRQNHSAKGKAARHRWQLGPAGRARDLRRNATRKELTGNKRYAFKPNEWNALLAFYSNHCAYCNSPFDLFNKPSQDHVIPLSRGGTHTKDNIVPSCLVCNGRKGDDVWSPRVPNPFNQPT